MHYGAGRAPGGEVTSGRCPEQLGLVAAAIVMLVMIMVIVMVPMIVIAVVVVFVTAVIIVPAVGGDDAAAERDGHEDAGNGEADGRTQGGIGGFGHLGSPEIGEGCVALDVGRECGGGVMLVWRE